MTREEIEQLDDAEPYSFETDREERWYKVGLKEGLETADQHPREGLWDAEKACKALKDYMLKERFFDNRIERSAIIDNIICGLCEAMEG